MKVSKLIHDLEKETTDLRQVNLDLNKLLNVKLT